MGVGRAPGRRRVKNMRNLAALGNGCGLKPRMWDYDSLESRCEVNGLHFELERELGKAVWLEYSPLREYSQHQDVRQHQTLLDLGQRERRPPSGV